MGWWGLFTDVTVSKKAFFLFRFLQLQRKASEVVRDAIDVGYRHFDCAHIYRNEQEVGEGFKEALESGVIKRYSFFIKKYYL